MNIAIDSEGVVIEKANSLPEAIALFGMREGKTAIIAGGTDLLPKLKNGEIAPEVLVDLSSLDELKTIADAGERIEIGALVTDAMIEKNPIIAAHLPALAAASERCSPEFIRHRATIGGNIMTASPAGDLLPVLVTFEAEFLLQNLTGERWVSALSFFTGRNTTAIQSGEMLTRIRLPKQQPGERVAFYKMENSPADWVAKVNLCARASIVHGGIERIAIAVGNAAVTVIRLPGTEALLNGQVLNSATIQKATLSIEDEVAPIDDSQATESDRRHLCGVLLSKFLKESGTG